MKLSLLLAGFYYLLKYTAWKHPEFKKRISEKNFTMLIRTKDNRHTRFYSFRKGMIISGTGECLNPEFTLVLADAARGFTLLKKQSPSAFMDAMSSGTLQVIDDAGIMLWFVEVINNMKKLNRFL